MSITAEQLEKEIREVEGIQVTIFTRNGEFQSYKDKWKRALSDDRRVSALKRRIVEVAPRASFNIYRADGVKVVYPQQLIGVVRGNKAETPA